MHRHTAIPRVAGWLAHWVESCKDPDTKIWRPRQVYDGESKRGYVPMEMRDQTASTKVEVRSTPRVCTQPATGHRVDGGAGLC